MHTNNTNYTRRTFLKTLSVASVGAAILPKFTIAKNQVNKPLHIIGLGGAGNNLLHEFYSNNITATYTSIKRVNTIDKTKHIEFIPFTAPTHKYMQHGLSFLTVEHIKNREALPNELYAVINKNKQYVLLAGLGGYTGTVLTLDFANRLQALNMEPIIMIFSPFKFENYSRKLIANFTIQQLQHVNRLHVYDLAQLHQQYGHLKMRTAFDLIHQQTINTFKQLYTYLPYAIKKQL